MHPADVVDGQLQAYNRKDLTAFLAYWAEDAEYYAHPNTLLAKGRAAIEQRHRQRFLEPDLYGQLERRIVLGSTVIDYETVVRNFPEGRGTLEVVCIYQIEHDQITKAWFIQGSPRLDQPAQDT